MAELTLTIHPQDDGFRENIEALRQAFSEGSPLAPTRVSIWRWPGWNDGTVCWFEGSDGILLLQNGPTWFYIPDIGAITFSWQASD